MKELTVLKKTKKQRKQRRNEKKENGKAFKDLLDTRKEDCANIKLEIEVTEVQRVF